MGPLGHWSLVPRPHSESQLLIRFLIDRKIFHLILKLSYMKMKDKENTCDQINSPCHENLLFSFSRVIIRNSFFSGIKCTNPKQNPSNYSGIFSQCGFVHFIHFLSSYMVSQRALSIVLIVTLFFIRYLYP